jgi:hypothetical protein
MKQVSDYLGDINTFGDYAFKAGLAAKKLPTDLKVFELGMQIAAEVKGPGQPVTDFANNVTRVVVSSWIAGIAGEAIFVTALAAAGGPVAAGALGIAGAALLGYYGANIVKHVLNNSPEFIDRYVDPIVSDALGSGQKAMLDFANYLEAEITNLYPTSPRRW